MLVDLLLIFGVLHMPVVLYGFCIKPPPLQSSCCWKQQTIRSSRNDDTDIAMTTSSSPIVTTVTTNATPSLLLPPNNLLPPLPDPTANPNDDIYRILRRALSLQVLHFIRDSGLAGLISDALIWVGIPALVLTNPQILIQFLALSGMTLSTSSGNGHYSFSTLRYGSHVRQYVDIIQETTTTTKQTNITTQQEQQQENHLVVFCHGGSWQAGAPWMYRTCANAFLDQNENNPEKNTTASTTVAIWGYRPYPITDAQGQIDDLVNCIAFLRKWHKNKNNNKKEDWDTITLVGHSSGGHIAIMATLQQNLLCDGVVAISSVNDVPNHFEWESCRGIEQVSALQPACGDTVDNWIKYSPTRCLQNGKDNKNTDDLPPMLLIHGACDTTIPYTSSLNLTKAMHQCDQDCTLHLLQDMGHVEPILQLTTGGITKDLIENWMAKMKTERRGENRFGESG